jgi:hypothetical protein
MWPGSDQIQLTNARKCFVKNEHAAAAIESRVSNTFSAETAIDCFFLLSKNKQKNIMRARVDNAWIVLCWWLCLRRGPSAVGWSGVVQID